MLVLLVHLLCSSHGSKAGQTPDCLFNGNRMIFLHFFFFCPHQKKQKQKQIGGEKKKKKRKIKKLDVNHFNSFDWKIVTFHLNFSLFKC